jgi:drug/metabolite transporter (DMT)-like permease
LETSRGVRGYHPGMNPYYAPLSLLVAATTWGLIWYPYRLLEQAGVSGGLASLLTYALALALVLATPRGRAWRAGPRGVLVAMALAAGWTNLAYVLAVIGGEIMRVMLLFYLAPLWTLPFAYLILGERPNAWAYLLVALSVSGAYIMLAADGGPPLPGNAAEWLGLSAGLGFALSNVLSRRLGDLPSETRATWVFAGVALIALPLALFEGQAGGRLVAMSTSVWPLLALTGALLVLATLTVQYGLARLPANRAIVILLVEVVVAALASWWLAGEMLNAREWLGGGLIVAASLLSGKVEENPHA